MTNTSGSRLISLKDASACTELSQWILREINWKVDLPLVKGHESARKWWFRREDLDTWIDRKTFTIKCKRSLLA